MTSLKPEPHTGPLPVHRPAPAAQGVAFLSIAFAAVVIVGYAIHMVGTRTLTKADYGRFVVVISTTTWIKVFLGALILPGLGKIVSENHGHLRPALAVALRWYGGLALVIFVLFLAATPLIARALDDPALAVLLLIAGLEFPFYTSVATGRQLLEALRQYVRSSATLVVYTVVRASGACALLLLGFGVIGGVAGLTLGSVGGAVMAWLFLLHMRRAIPPVPYPNMVRRSLHWTALTLPSSLGVSTLMNLDLWFLTRFLENPENAGLYAAAFAVSRLPDQMAQGLLGATFGRVSGALAEGKKDLARSVAAEAMRFLFITFLPVCFLAAGSPSEILTLLFTSQYSESGTVLVLLIAAVSCAAMLKLTLSLLAASDRPASRMVFVLALLPISVGLLFVLVPRQGMTGAATASLVTMSVGACVGMTLVYRFLGVTPPFASAVRCLLAGGTVWGISRLWPAAGVMLVAKIGLLGLAYLVLLIVLRELRGRDWNAVRKAVLTPFARRS